MRESLFKGKRKDNGEWVEGGYFQEPYTDSVFIIVWNSTGLGYNEFIEIIPETLCQYTGCTDKNGKMIWENDICHTHGINDDICVIRYGEYKDNSQKFHIGFYTDWRDFKDLFRKDLGFWVNECELKVIANAIDKPNLMEVKNESSIIL